LTILMTYSHFLHSSMGPRVQGDAERC
jgi:hypothetical protein